MKKEIKIYDVTEEYYNKATPGVGKVLHEKGTEENDQRVSEFLFKTFGGNIITLKVEKVNGRDVKTPDALWDGKYWEYKNISSITSIEDRMKSAWHQLRGNAIRKNLEGEPVGVVIDILNRHQNAEISIRVIEIQFYKKIMYPADLIIKEGNKIIKIIRNDIKYH